MSLNRKPERPHAPLAAAREVWSRAVAQLDAGTLSRRGYEAAAEKLRAIRSALEQPERSRIDVYRQLLEQAWEDRAPEPVPARLPGSLGRAGVPQASDLLVRAHGVLAAGFTQGGDGEDRRQRARASLRELERLATEAVDDWERFTIVRLADPLLRMLSALEAEAGAAAPQ